SIVLSAGAWLYRAGIKKHFLDTYLHVGANVLLMAALSGVGDRTDGMISLAILVALAATALILGFRYRRFAFVAYGIGYGYIGISWQLLRSISGDIAVLSYFVVTGTLVIVGMIILARQFGHRG